MSYSLKRLIHHEATGGILLILAAGIALIAANTPLQVYYNQLLSTRVMVAVGNFALSKPLLLWINDGLMTLFFLVVGLELKREMRTGSLNSVAKIALPAIAAIGGMLVPALIYAAINRNDEYALQGWAIPTATDIAFALGVFSLLGSRIPSSLKVFLVSLAIFDDIGAIVIIALFYTDNLSITAMACAGTGIAILWFMNYQRVLSTAAYLLVGLFIWVSLLKSGVHATLSGILLAMFIPFHGEDSDGKPVQPMYELEKDLHGPVAYLVLPLFAFANAGLDLSGLTLADLLAPVPLGILLGLFIGKQIGVLLFTWIAVTFKLGRLAEDVSWSQLYGVALLCGIGFTMSLFIGALAFEQTIEHQAMHDRLGILVGSLFSAIGGYIWLAYLAKPVLPRKKE